MADELDTSWFDLSIYEPLKTMSIEGWASVIDDRDYIDSIYDCQQKGEDYEWTLQEMANELKTGVYLSSVNDVVKSYIEDYEKEIRYPFSTSSVDSLRNYQLWHMATGEFPSQALRDIRELREYLMKPQEKLNIYLIEAGHDPYDFRFKQYLNKDYIPSSAHVVIDLSMPNEQIKDDFNRWLTHYRKVSGVNVPKKKKHQKKHHQNRFTQKTFNYWIEYGLIPYIDLKLIAKIEGKEITQQQMADLIFPNPVGFTSFTRLRDNTIPEAERLMSESMRWALLQQAANEKLTGTKKKPKST